MKPEAQTEDASTITGAPLADAALLPQVDWTALQAQRLNHAPRILLLYGSNRERSYSRLAVLEAGRILQYSKTPH